MLNRTAQAGTIYNIDRNNNLTRVKKSGPKGGFWNE